MINKNNILKMKTQHDGDCSIYASLSNGNPEDGICMCGYGHQLMRKGDYSQMYSRELQEILKSQKDINYSRLEKLLKENKELKNKINNHKCPTESEQRREREYLEDINRGLRRAY